MPSASASRPVSTASTPGAAWPRQCRSRGCAHARAATQDDGLAPVRAGRCRRCRCRRRSAGGHPPSAAPAGRSRTCPRLPPQLPPRKAGPARPVEGGGAASVLGDHRGLGEEMRWPACASTSGTPRRRRRRCGPKCAAFLAEAGRDWSPGSAPIPGWASTASFSREVGKRGWIGMTWPKRYGGGERTALERYVVLEEMLAVGAPVGAHWIGDRQSGPLILRLGTEEQRREFLPRIVRGELAFAIGLSEPDSGSDLASLRTRGGEGAGRVEDQWPQGLDHQRPSLRLHDRPAAHRAGAGPQGAAPGAVAVPGGPAACPASPSARSSTWRGRKASTRSPSTTSSSPTPAGRARGRRLGTGDRRAGLRARRAGALPLLPPAADRGAGRPARGEPAAAETVGRLSPAPATLRQMSLAVAGMLQDGKTPAREAALVKDAGNDWEQALPETLRDAARPGAHAAARCRRCSAP